MATVIPFLPVRVSKSMRMEGVPILFMGEYCVSRLLLVCVLVVGVLRVDLVDTCEVLMAGEDEAV